MNSQWTQTFALVGAFGVSLSDIEQVLQIIVLTMVAAGWILNQWKDYQPSKKKKKNEED